MSAGESLAVAFLSPKGVLKERRKIERVMKTSTVLLFGLKQTNKQTKHILVRQMLQMQYIFWGNGTWE